GMLKLQRAAIVFGGFECSLPTHVLADRDELHFRSDDALPGVMDLSDRTPGFCAERTSSSTWERIKPALVFYQGKVTSPFSEITVILRHDLSTFVFFDTTASYDPIPSQRWEPVVDTRGDARIAPRTAGIVDPHGWIFFNRTVNAPSHIQMNFAHRHANIGAAALDINSGRGRELKTAFGVSV